MPSGETAAGAEDAARRAAHDWAAEAREVRRRLLDDLSAGREHLEGALARAATDPMIGRIQVLCVLEALPAAGKVATRRALDALGIDHRTPLADVSAEQLGEQFGFQS